MKIIAKSMAISALALVVVVSITTAATNVTSVKKFAEKVVARSLTVQQDMLVKGNLTVEGNFDPRTINEVLGSQPTTWTATIYDTENGNNIVDDGTVSGLSEYQGEQLSITFTPSSSTAGTFTSTPLNIFDETTKGYEATENIFTGDYQIVGSIMYILNGTTPNTDECIEQYQEENAPAHCYVIRSIELITVFPSGRLELVDAGGHHVILEPAE